MLEVCAKELSPVLRSLLYDSRTSAVPTLWKTSTIIPLPKKPRPSELTKGQLHFPHNPEVPGEAEAEHHHGCQSTAGPAPVHLQSEEGGLRMLWHVSSTPWCSILNTHPSTVRQSSRLRVSYSPPWSHTGQ